MNSPAVKIKQATALLTVEQIIAAARQLDAKERDQVFRALQTESDEYYLSVAALNSPAAVSVWDNPADAAAYDAIPWEPGDASSTR